MNAPALDRDHSRPLLSLIALFVTIALMITLYRAGITSAATKPLAFSPGEKLTFQVRWSFIPAGEAVLQVRPIETIDGVRAYHFVMTARTYPLIDLFYKVRDRIDSYTDSQMTHTLLYKKQNRGRTTRDIVVTFNWEKQEAQYSNNGQKASPISLVPGSFDPLSIFYAFRRYDLAENLVIQAPVADGKKCVMGKATVIKRETITVVSGTYDTYLVEPDLKHIGGVFQKSPHAKLKIWVTADSRRIPVKVKSKVVVGSFVAELIKRRQSKEEGSRSRVQRFNGSKFTKSPPAIPARHKSGGLAYKQGQRKKDNPESRFHRETVNPEL